VIRRALVLALASFAFAACGGGNATQGEAIDVQEGDEVRFGQIAYRVVSFRELNPAVDADRTLVRSVGPAPRRGLYAAFIRACNRGDEPVAPAAAFRLRDAFGSNYAPLRDGLELRMLFAPERLSASACIPRDDSVAERTFEGAALVFELPRDIARNRPLLLEIRSLARGGELARIALDD
jgi:hypothetical protein